MVIVGGALVGLAIGYLSTSLFVRADEPFSGILLTVAVALGTFQIGHLLGVSEWWGGGSGINCRHYWFI